MAVPNSQYANELIAGTFDECSGMVYDQVYRTTPLLDWLKRNQDVVGGGKLVTTKLLYAGGGRAKGFTTGSSFDLAQSDQFSRSMFPWVNYGVPVLVYDQDVMKNSGDAQIIDLAKEHMAEAKLDLADALASDLLAAAYTDQSTSALPSLLIACDATSTIGGIAYDAFPGSNFEWVARLTSSGTFSIGMLETAYNNCGLGKGGVYPTDLFGAQNMVESYKNLAGDYGRVDMGGKGGTDVDLGFERVYFRGKSFWLEPYLSDGVTLLLNKDLVKLVAHRRNARRFITEVKPVSRTPGATEHTFWGMFSFRLKRRASIGMLTGITAVT